jgi:hypothetical protein
VRVLSSMTDCTLGFEGGCIVAYICATSLKLVLLQHYGSLILGCKLHVDMPATATVVLPTMATTEHHIAGESFT